MGHGDQSISGLTGRGAECPRDFWPGNFCWRIGKKEGKEKGKRGENWEEKKENWKKDGGKLKMEVGKVIKRVETPFFFFFAFHFWKRQKFVLGLPKWEFSTGKRHFTPGKKSGKNDLPLPPRKICLLCPCDQYFCNFFTHIQNIRNPIHTPTQMNQCGTIVRTGPIPSLHLSLRNLFLKEWTIVSESLHDNTKYFQQHIFSHFCLQFSPPHEVVVTAAYNLPPPPLPHEVTIACTSTLLHEDVVTVSLLLCNSPPPPPPPVHSN